jgi:hypothetical protein
MRHYGEDGLGGSMLIYIAAIVCGLAVLIVPVLMTHGPTVLANPGARSFTQIDSLRDGNQYPVAKLHSEAIVDPAITAALSAKNTATETARRRPAHDGSVRMSRHRHAAPPARRERVRNAYASGRPVGAHTPGPFQKMYQIY